MKMSSGVRLFAAAVIVSSLVGCARGGVNLNKVSAVKTAAIVGFHGEVDIREDRPEYQGSSVGGTLSGIQGLTDVGSAEVEQRRAEEGKNAYDTIAAKLATGMGWTVTPRDTVAADAEMKKLFAEKMSNVKVNKGFRFGVDNILWSDMADLTVEQQQALKKSLGVDVLLVVKTQVKQGNAYGYGVGQDGVFDINPKAILSLTAFDGGEEGAIWKEAWVEGNYTEGKMKRTMGVNDTTDEAKLVVEATSLAADALLAKYAKAKAEAPGAAAPAATAATPAP